MRQVSWLGGELYGRYGQIGPKKEGKRKKKKREKKKKGRRCQGQPKK